MCAAVRPSTSSLRTIRLSLLSRIARTVANRPRVELEVHGSGRRQRERVEVGEAEAGAATGAGKRARLTHRPIERAGAQGCGLPACNRNGAHSRRRKEVAEDLQPVIARRKLDAQARLALVRGS